MSIEINDTAAPQRGAPEPTASFAAAPSGSTGNLDFLGLQDLIGIQSVDPNIEPYLEGVTEAVKKAIPGVERRKFPRRENCHGFIYRGEDGYVSAFCILFTTTGDPVTPSFHPTSMRGANLNEDLREMYPGERIRLIDMRVIISDSPAEMARVSQMANAIVTAFQVVTVQRAKDATVSEIGTVEFSPDWSPNNARSFIEKYSPHSVLPRSDLGMVLRAKIDGPNTNPAMRDLETTYRAVAAITGYVEFKEKEVVPTGTGQMATLYTPVFNITSIMSTMPLPGMATIVMAALAPAVYNSKWWARQWTNFSKDLPNPGTLEMDPDGKNQPYFVESQEEMLKFLGDWCTAPKIAFQLQDGRDIIPGMQYMVSEDSQEQAHFLQNLMHFYHAENDLAPGTKICETIEYRFDGVYGEPNGVLVDSREIDYLSMIARGGAGSVSLEDRAVLLGVSDRPQDRAAIVSRFTGRFVPEYLTTVSLLNPAFLDWVVSKIKARGLAIIDPNHMAEGRTFSSFGAGFGSGAGMASPIQSGLVRPGLNLSSNWSR